MPKDEERSRNGRDDRSNGELTDALVGVVKGNKELLASAAISAAGAINARSRSVRSGAARTSRSR